jgi:hypothetical protein
MLAELIPECPRLHHGIMAVDPDAEYGVEFVCRLCGTRIYPNKPELIPEAEVLIPDQLQRCPGSCIKCGSPSDTHLLCRTCRRKDR